MPDLIIIGAGASGLMCAARAGQRGLDVLVLERNAKPGIKILVSGGGRCNFTNTRSDARRNFLSQNPPFCISALRRYPPEAFVELVDRHGIAWHEKTPGQLFCDESAQQIVDMLLAECEAVGARVLLNQEVSSVEASGEGGFEVLAGRRVYRAPRVVIACGGLSLPKVASPLAFQLANELDVAVVPPRAALVPFTWNNDDKARYRELSGVSTECEAHCDGTRFRENLLFTHRGLSGPAMLQISSFWREGDVVDINLLPGSDALGWLQQGREEHPQQQLSTLLRTRLPRRLVEIISGHWFEDGKLAELGNRRLAQAAAALSAWRFKPGGTEGYRTAEVTLGGIATDELSSKTFELSKVPGLYAIGEAIDVTGWLGGHNFQWAWASAVACAEGLPDSSTPVP